VAVRCFFIADLQANLGWYEDKEACRISSKYVRRGSCLLRVTWEDSDIDVV
jgi:hypothetical protein